MRWLFALLFTASGVHAQDEFRQTLLSVAENRSAQALTISSKDVTPNAAHPWNIEVKRLHGGKQEGVTLVIVDNGVLKITLIPTRGMGIQEVRRAGVRIGWDSPVKEIVHPQFVNMTARGGLGWLDGFTEFVVRCGLENNGQPGPDRFINNVGDEASMDLTLHGKIANQPAQEVEIVVDKKHPFRITVRGIVNERMLFGPKLELMTELTTTPGAATFQIKDVVTNRGAGPEEFQMLYHVNVGKPVLEAGARFEAPVAKVTPYNKNAGRDVATWNQYLAPTTGYVEQVYLLEPLANKEGRTTILLANQAGTHGTSIRYQVKELPYLTLWKNTGADADGYVTGLEPGTNYPNRRSVERQAGRVPKLAGGVSYSMSLEFGVHLGTKEVDAVRAEVQAIQGDRKPVLVTAPTPRIP